MTFWVNGHHFIERELLRQGVRFRKNDNAFLAVADPNALQSAADRLSADISRIETAYRKTDKSIEQVIQLLAA